VGRHTPAGELHSSCDSGWTVAEFQVRAHHRCFVLFLPPSLSSLRSIFVNHDRCFVPQVSGLAFSVAALLLRRGPTARSRIWPGRAVGVGDARRNRPAAASAGGMRRVRGAAHGLGGLCSSGCMVSQRVAIASHFVLLHQSINTHNARYWYPRASVTLA
jgi:hypothetical protein